MKKALLIFSTFLFVFRLSSQPHVDDAVQQSIDNQTWKRVLLTLNEQLDARALKQDFRKNEMPVNQRPRLVLEALDEISRQTQNALIDDLHVHGTPFTLHHQIQIVNMISMDAHPATLAFLAEHEAIRSIVPDESPFSLIEPVGHPAPTSRAQNSSEIGLTVIGAPEMWALGYTGRGRMAYSVDTGIWPNHPAVKRQWKGHRAPLAECWLAWDRETPGDKANSHGTHTTGTILGLDTANNDTIGAAFNAYFIATDPVVSDLADIRPLSDYIIAYQWCLNPDGDISTSHDVPDAINNSWGRQPGNDATYCDEDMTQMFAVLELAGIANVSSAGNSGPEPQTLTVPHNISIHETNGFTVGSINGNSSNLPISTFSSRGPGQCGGDGSILIKPEVVAPGQGVRSAVGQDEYASLSGTSMACPHVVGAVLLLKEAFPYLPGQDLLEALYYTAIDLGEAGEDNTYGQGVIHVFLAYEYLESLGHNPVPPNQSPFDLVVTEVISPLDGATCSTTITPQIVVKNAGIEPIQGFNIVYGEAGTPGIVSDYDETLNPNATVTINLPSFEATSSGFTEFFFRVEPYENFTELDIVNNQLMSRVSVKEQVSLPFVDNFENPFLNTGWWHINNADNQTTWELYATGGLPESEQSMRVNLYNYSPRESQKDDLIGPRVEMPGSGYVYLDFDLAYKVRNAPEILFDSLEVWIADNCALENPVLVYSTGGQEMNTHDVTTQNFVPDSINQWRAESIDISQFAGSGIIVPFFRTINRKGDNVYIDNVSIYASDNPLSISENNVFDVRIFPNPANDLVNIKFAELNAPIQISLWDATGRVLWNEESRSETLFTFSAANLAPGVYLVRLANDEHSQTLRFVVQ